MSGDDADKPPEGAGENPPEPRGLQLDRTSRQVWVDGVPRPQRLTKSQIKLLRFLGSRRDEVCPRKDTVWEVYGNVYVPQVDDGRLDAMVERTRRKIEENPRKPRFLLTVRAVGHRLNEYLRERR